MRGVLEADRARGEVTKFIPTPILWSVWLQTDGARGQGQRYRDISPVRWNVGFKSSFLVLKDDAAQWSAGAIAEARHGVHAQALLPSVPIYVVSNHRLHP